MRCEETFSWLARSVTTPVPFVLPPSLSRIAPPSADACRRYKHMLKHMNRPRHNFYLWRIIYLHNCWVEHRRKQRQRQQAGAGAGGAGASPEGQQISTRS